MNILRKAFKIFNGSSWDEYHLKTDSKQVVHTKADGTDTTVEEQLLTLNSTLSKAITYKSYDITLQENAYVSPYSYYLNWYITDGDISKYGMPVSISIIGAMGIPTPCAIVYADEVKKYRCTAVANSPKVTAHVLFLKFLL